MTDLHINNRLWLTKDGISYLGQGRVQLLKGIIEFGSISAAARSMGMSYRKAWQAVESMNSLSDEPLVIRTAGGNGGGGTTVTEAGRRTIGIFDGLNERCRIFLHKEMKTLLK